MEHSLNTWLKSNTCAHDSKPPNYELWNLYMTRYAHACKHACGDHAFWLDLSLVPGIGSNWETTATAWTSETHLESATKPNARLKSPNMNLFVIMSCGRISPSWSARRTICELELLQGDDFVLDGCCVLVKYYLIWLLCTQESACSFEFVFALIFHIGLCVSLCACM